MFVARQPLVIPIFSSDTPAPESWHGGFHFPYKIGIESSGPTVTIQVNAKLRSRNITNIVGTILGEEEPDKWVILGSHRDAWGFGAVDSSSGTAVMMEVARGLKALVKTGTVIHSCDEAWVTYMGYILLGRIQIV